MDGEILFLWEGLETNFVSNLLGQILKKYYNSNRPMSIELQDFIEKIKNLLTSRGKNCKKRDNPFIGIQPDFVYKNSLKGGL